MDTKKIIIELLRSTKRSGIDDIINYLIEGGFFESPASRDNHGDRKGGLASHSLRVRELLLSYQQAFRLSRIKERGQKPLKITKATLIIAPILHDVCKVGMYIGRKKPYKLDPDRDRGHAALSIERIDEYIDLTDLEEMMIKYHMGVYGLEEFDENTGEYGLRGGQMAYAWYHNPIVKIMYFCDEQATFEEKYK